MNDHKDPAAFIVASLNFAETCGLTSPELKNVRVRIIRDALDFFEQRKREGVDPLKTVAIFVNIKTIEATT